MPFDEVLFFVAIPIAAILTLEAVRSVKPHWGVGDEASAEAQWSATRREDDGS